MVLNYQRLSCPLLMQRGHSFLQLGESFMNAPSPAAIATRRRLVEEHVNLENAHDLDGIVSTFGNTARYDDQPWNAHYVGREQVRLFYRQLLHAVPDLHIDIQQTHLAEDTIILEVIIRGRHLGHWRGLSPTGRPVELALCGIYTFDEEDRLAGEKIYYDRATLLGQLGIFHEPESFRGRLTTALTHPATMMQVVLRKLLRSAVE
jgi:steroid delta-isomerase-like uncharacterized protein